MRFSEPSAVFPVQRQHPLFWREGNRRCACKEANAKVIEHCKFPLDPYFEHNDLKANPDGVYYKVWAS